MSFRSGFLKSFDEQIKLSPMIMNPSRFALGSTVLYDKQGGSTAGGLNTNIRGFGNKILTGQTDLIGKTITKVGFRLKDCAAGATITFGVFDITSGTPVFIFGTVLAAEITSSFVTIERENLTGHVLTANQVLGWKIDGTYIVSYERYSSGSGADANVIANYWATSSAPNWAPAGDNQDLNMIVEGF